MHSGCTVFAGGTGQTEQQVQAMAELKPAGYIGTPSFLKIIVEKAAEMGVPLPSVRKCLSMYFVQLRIAPDQRQRRRGGGGKGAPVWKKAAGGAVTTPGDSRRKELHGPPGRPASLRSRRRQVWVTPQRYPTSATGKPAGHKR
jgi:hypothetical protein